MPPHPQNKSIAVGIFKGRSFDWLVTFIDYLLSVILDLGFSLDFEAFEQSSGGDSHALDGYALYDLGTRKLLGIIEECRLRVEYEYTAESRIVLLDPDGDFVDYTFSKP